MGQKKHKRRAVFQQQADNKSALQASSVVVAAAVAVPESPADGSAGLEYTPTICSVCGKGEDEDLVLLCDSPGCSNEIHMYCLCPPVYAIPAGEWLCPTCSPQGTSELLDRFVDDFQGMLGEAVAAQRDSQCGISTPIYDFCLTVHQQAFYEFGDWKTDLSANQLVPSEFSIDDNSLIGRSIRVHCPSDEQYHCGRIISRRFREEYSQWQHLVLFRRFSTNSTLSGLITVDLI